MFDRTEIRHPLPLSETPTALTPPLRKIIDSLPEHAQTLDIGCLGWKLHRHRPGLSHHGCDIVQTTSLPENAIYRECDVDTARLPWSDDRFDLVVASHVIEHLRNPLHLVAEMVRVCRPGGLLYIEAPSERSILGPGLASAPHGFLSHWDDPTHQRPWTPGALYRAYLGYGCKPLQWGHDTSTRSRLLFPLTVVRCLMTRDWDQFTDEWWRVVGFAAYATAIKPPALRGEQPFQYRSLKGLSRGAIEAHFEPLMAERDQRT